MGVGAVDDRLFSSGSFSSVTVVPVRPSSARLSNDSSRATTEGLVCVPFIWREKGGEGRMKCERPTVVDGDRDRRRPLAVDDRPTWAAVPKGPSAEGRRPFALCPLPFACRPLHTRPRTPTTVRRDRACEPSLRTESRRVGRRCDGITRARQRAHWMKALDVVRHPDCGEQLASQP